MPGVTWANPSNLSCPYIPDTMLPWCTFCLSVVWKEKHITKRQEEEFGRRKEWKFCLSPFIYYFKGGMRPDWIPVWVCILVNVSTGIWNSNALHSTCSLWLKEFSVLWIKASLPITKWLQRWKEWMSALSNWLQFQSLMLTLLYDET